MRKTHLYADSVRTPSTGLHVNTQPFQNECVTLKRANRLRKTSDFVAVRRGGRSWADSMLVLNARPNDSQTSRFGFTVSKRLGSAVERNRIRRRLKAAIASANVKCGWDVVVVARQRARHAGFHALQGSIDRLLLRADLIGRPCK